MSGTLIASERDIPRDDKLFFEHLYRTSFGDIYAYVANLLQDRSAAEDVTQVTFERAFRARTRFDPNRGTPRAWLFTIAHKLVVDEVRKRQRRQIVMARAIDPEVLRPEHPPEDERSPVVTAAVERLCERDRQLVGLKYDAGLSNGEIAVVLGISETNVGTRLHRIMEVLREACHAVAR
jgi:RNA polymerase sigma-70 factor, ECF subfamily